MRYVKLYCYKNVILHGYMCKINALAYFKVSEQREIMKKARCGHGEKAVPASCFMCCLYMQLIVCLSVQILHAS